MTIDFDAIGGSYVAALNEDGTELTGTMTQGPLTLPVTFGRIVQ